MNSSIYVLAVEAFLRDFKDKVETCPYTPEIAHMHMDLGRRSGKSMAALDILNNHNAVLIEGLFPLMGMMKQQWIRRGSDPAVERIYASKEVHSAYVTTTMQKISFIIINEPFLHSRKSLKKWHALAKSRKIPVIHLGQMKKD